MSKIKIPNMMAIKWRFIILNCSVFDYCNCIYFKEIYYYVYYRYLFRGEYIFLDSIFLASFNCMH